MAETVLNEKENNQLLEATKPSICTILYNRKLDEQIEDKDKEQVQFHTEAKTSVNLVRH